MKKHQFIVIILLFFYSCNVENEINFSIQEKDYLSTIDSINTEFNYLKDETFLNEDIIKNYIPDSIINSTLSLFHFKSPEDSINVITLMKMNFLRVLNDTNYIILDSLLLIYPKYCFPIDEILGNYYSNKFEIFLSDDLTIDFCYTKGFKYIDDKVSLKKEDIPTIKKLKKERFDRFQVNYHSKLIFSTEFDYFKKNIILYYSSSTKLLPPRYRTKKNNN